MSRETRIEVKPYGADVEIEISSPLINVEAIKQNGFPEALLELLRRELTDLAPTVIELLNLALARMREDEDYKVVGNFLGQPVTITSEYALLYLAEKNENA